jgi:hypothetical protein
MIGIGMVFLVDIFSEGKREIWLIDEDCESSEASRIITL